jgi:hypothetical protein
VLHRRPKIILSSPSDVGRTNKGNGFEMRQFTQRHRVMAVSLLGSPFAALWILIVLVNLMFCPTISAQTNATTFTFTLDEPCKTSAGVFLPDGTLVRTLWSKVRYYAPGTYSAVWDGLDDNSNAVSAGTYQIKVLLHNTEYIWDGAIGNTSQAAAGPTVHSSFFTMHGMAIFGSNAFYTTGYQEGRYCFNLFCTNNPQVVLNKFGGPIPEANDFTQAATDGNRVYFGCPVSLNPTNSSLYNYRGFIVAYTVSNLSAVTFPAGLTITNNSIANGIYAGIQPGLSGLSVQVTNNLLAASSRLDNMVYLFDKTSGVLVANFSVDSPTGVSFSPDGTLWVASTNAVFAYTNVAGQHGLALTISGFSNALAIAVCPTNAALILVADGGGSTNMGGGSQQIKAFDNTGAPLWTYGLAGGYPANGPAVTTNKFMFTYDLEQSEGTFIAFAPDGSFWVGDGGDHRSLHFSPSCSYLEQIMYQPHSYKTCVDQNNPGRVFNQYLEFSVDYTKPLSNAWTLVNNWNPSPASYGCYYSDAVGLQEVVTLTNGRTYGLLQNRCAGGNDSEVFELTTNGIRFTHLFPSGTNVSACASLDTSGNAYIFTPGIASWYERVLTGFDGSNNPVFAPKMLIASAPNGASNPVPRLTGNERTVISSNNILISLDQGRDVAWHLGGVRLGGTSWLWQTSPAGYLNGCGNFEISNHITYCGNFTMAIDRQVLYGFHGEFYQGQGEAGQCMHYYDDGLFVGQFGQCNVQQFGPNLPVTAFAGNGYSPCFVKSTDGEYYYWVNDEGQHGPQRWHIVNARNIREMTGSGALGSTITLTSQTYNFPSAISGLSGNRGGNLSWNSVPGATSYNIRYSLINGGPYQIVAGTATQPSYAVTGLTNGITYYFAVTAVVNGVEGPASEQVEIWPFDTTQTVVAVGQSGDNVGYTPTIFVSSTAASSNTPSFIGIDRYTAVLNPRELCYYGFGSMMNTTIGRQGYVIFDYQGPGLSLTNLISSYAITNAVGWRDKSSVDKTFAVDGIVGNHSPAYSWAAQPSRGASLDIKVSDTNYHYLTVFSPDIYQSDRTFTMSLVSTNGTSAQYAFNQFYGNSYFLQFLFKGNVSLICSNLNSTLDPYHDDATVQALFLDDFGPVGAVGSPIPSPPTDLRVIAP